MIVENLSEPFWHTIIYDFYTPEEEKLIWQELDYLDLPNKPLLHASETGDPEAVNRSRLFLDNLYGYNYRHFSKILNITSRKIFSQEFLDLTKSNPFSNHLKYSNTDSTLVSYYKNKSSYPLHFDVTTLSSITTFWKKPQKFTGGHLVFGEYNYIPEMDHNTLIFFPGFVKHSVTETIIDEEDELAGNSRYSITKFYTTEHTK